MVRSIYWYIWIMKQFYHCVTGRVIFIENSFFFRLSQYLIFKLIHKTRLCSDFVFGENSFNTESPWICLILSWRNITTGDRQLNNQIRIFERSFPYLFFFLFANLEFGTGWLAFWFVHGPWFADVYHSRARIN